MKHELNERLYATASANYKDAFWKAMRGNSTAYGDLDTVRDRLTGTYLFPAKTASDYATALMEQSLFRRIGTVLTKTAHDSHIWLSDNENLPQWVTDGEAIPTAEDNTFPRRDVYAHKLAILTSLDADFVGDVGFDLERYLISQFSKRFGKAEENAFINGTGVAMPKGILHNTEGAETGVTVTGDITFDVVMSLYFSLDKRYRSNGAWLMNDETALKLKTLKD